MITEDYVSYEVAKLLKEKGFDEPCSGFYTISPILSYTLSNATNSIWDKDKSTMGYISAPTHQMAMKWLREKQGIFIGIQPYDSYYENRYEFEISIEQNNSYEWDFKDVENSIFKGYENTVEAALKYCLENLI